MDLVEAKDRAAPTLFVIQGGAPKSETENNFYTKILVILKENWRPADAACVCVVCGKNDL